MLQMSARGQLSHRSNEAGSRCKDDSFSASKENLGDSFNSAEASPSIIPGMIDGDNSPRKLSALSPQSVKKVTMSPHRLLPTPPPLPSHGYAAAVAPCKVANLDDAHSSRGGSSARSFEYLTPEETPRTPPVLHSTVAAQKVLLHRPVSAPSAPGGQPRSNARKDFSICKRTGTVIPSVPPMPTSALRTDASSPSCDSKDTSCRSVDVGGLPEARPLPRRPYSAAADNALSAYGVSGESLRRRSESSIKELICPTNVLSAARHGRYAEVESALVAGFVPNYRDIHGNTVFHIACQNGRRRIAKLVVKHGCDMNAKNLKGNTGLHFLFAYGYPDIAEYFINKGADELIKNFVGKTAREGIK